MAEISQVKVGWHSKLFVGKFGNGVLSFHLAEKFINFENRCIIETFENLRF